MATIKDALEKAIEVMNIASMEMQIEDEYQPEFEALFEKAAKKAEQLIRIKTLAEGRREC